MGIVENFKKRGFKDIFSTRVFSYLESKIQAIFGIFIKKEDAVAYAEQVIFKRAMCPECYQNGSCIHCGCNFSELSVSKKAKCSEKRWGVMMNKEDWSEYKNKFLRGIDFGFVKIKTDDKANNISR
jgi:hypothetical protein